MNNIWRCLAVMVAIPGALLCPSTLLACDRPADISVVSGKVATRAEIEAANDVLQNYIAAMKAYQACLASEASKVRMNSAGLDSAALVAYENQYAANHNDASNAMRNAAERFNRAVADFVASN